MAEGVDVAKGSGVWKKRLITLTPKAQERFNERVQHHLNKLKRSWQTITEKLDNDYSNTSFDILTILFGNYKLDHEMFMQLLSQYRTKDSEQLSRLYNTRFESNAIYIKGVLDQKRFKDKDHKTVKSTSSCHSENSSTRDFVMRKAAEAKAAQVRAKYAERESELKKKQANIDADLELLRHKREAAALATEANELVSLAGDSQQGSVLGDILLIPEEDPISKVEHYIKQQTNSVPNVIVHSDHNKKDYTCIDNAENTVKITNVDNMLHDTAFQGNNVNNFTQYLMKKDLAVTRLVQFDDKPERYISWKISFRSVMSEAGMTPVEELDLLVKWLGPTSGNHARSIRSTNASNPKEGLQILWKRLDERYGSPEIIETTLRQRLEKFQKLTPRDNIKLYDLLDILVEIQSVKDNNTYSATFSCFDSAIGINQIVFKLPPRLQNKWMDRAAAYKRSHQASFPPFSYFVEFVQDQASVMNDPGINFYNSGNWSDTSSRQQRSTDSVRTRRTDVEFSSSQQHESTNYGATRPQNYKSAETCPFHKNAPHSLNDCKTFRQKAIEVRKAFLREQNMCYKCATYKHMARDCKVNVKCIVCNSKKHPSALHDDSYNLNQKSGSTGRPAKSDGDSQPKQDYKLQSSKDKQDNVKVGCTEVCGCESFGGKSCAKVQLVKVYGKGTPENSVTVYAMLDEQSNRTLVSPSLLNALGVYEPAKQYNISTCSGEYTAYGRRAEGFMVRSIDGTSKLELPTMIECDNIPKDHTEIPSPEVAMNYEHLKHIAHEIQRVDQNIEIGLLIGRDLLSAHHVYDQIIGPQNTPFAQKLPLGWVIIGEACLGKTHRPKAENDNIKCFKTFVMKDGKNSIFEPCESKLLVKDSDIFVCTQDDEKIGQSQEDREFIEIMENECQKGSTGMWTAPLPFKTPRRPLPNNRKVAWKRAMILDANLKRDSVKRELFVKFMQKVLDSGAAEVAPAPDPKGEVWYLPLFIVSNPKKPGKLRGVFDSSADFEGVSLNSVLLGGPNLTNSLLHILLRFRKNKYAISGDIEQMFYRFLVEESHRDFLRFFWYSDNNPNSKIIEYRMKVHVFGNSPSPAVATYMLRKAVENANSDVKSFVNDDFYVDDALTSKSEVKDVVHLMKQTQQVLKENGNIRLHKIVSNSLDVLQEFPEEDLGENMKSLIEDKSTQPTQRSLGMTWNLNVDKFSFEVKIKDNISTKREMLSYLNSIFDPIGFLSPLIIQGRILIRELTTESTWDENLSPDCLEKWNKWMSQMSDLGTLEIPRMFIPESIDTVKDIQIDIFCDASEKAIAASAYITAISFGIHHSGFVMGKTKLAPAAGHTIPRLELCSAVLAVEIGETLSEALQIPLEKITYHSDSRVVLGYISNRVKRFHTYVSNRVERILRASAPKQWTYVNSNKNPADEATRASMSVDKMRTSLWLNGPPQREVEQEISAYPLINPIEDPEIRQDKVTSYRTGIQETICDRFERFSSWKRLVTAFVVVKRAARNFKSRKSVGNKVASSTSVDYRREAELFIVAATQSKSYTDEIKCLEASKAIDRNSSIIQLNPFIDREKIVRVGGRLGQLDSSVLSRDLVKPIVISNRDHISTLLVRYYHELCNHQGRHITEGTIRNAGYWIVGAKRLISSIIHRCVTCRKSRGKTEQQLMADLPADRLIPGPPFSYVGVDVFGPWEVVARRTRGGVAQAKRWAALFTCLTTRAVHIEVLEEMSSSSFINALRRFIAIRGNVKEFRSDRGTNFVGAMDDLKFNVVNVEDGPVADCLTRSKVTWKFNPPHSSHMGGVWERVIGMSRRILDNVLSKSANKHLTHEVLVTLMAEVMSILNSRPIAPISSDPDNVTVLTPSILLNQKIDGDPSVCFDFDLKDMYKKQWKMVQVLSDLFWKQWRDNYLHTLQTRRKWQTQEVCIKNGDIVLLKDKNIVRAEWPIGVVTNAIPSESDKLVRKAEVRVCKHGRCNTYTRPVTDMILLVEYKP